MLALEVPSTGAVFPWSLALYVPGQQLRKVVGGAMTALTFYWLGRAHREQQGFMESTAEVWAAVVLELADAASFPLSGVLAALAPHTQLSCTALLILFAWHVEGFAG